MDLSGTMRVLSRSSIRHYPAPLRVFYVVVVCGLIGACGVRATDTLTPIGPIEEISSRSTPLATSKPPNAPTFTASVVATAVPEATGMIGPTLTPSPTLVGPQVILNSGFDSGIKHWEHPYGSLEHTTSVYHSGSGAAELTTSDETGFLEYRGNVGQCIDLTSFLADWLVVGDQMYMTLEAYLRTDAGITNASLNGIFVDDTRCGTGLIDSFEIPPIEGDQEWTRLSATTIIPATAKSLHVYISATGTSDSAVVYIDDVRAYSSTLEGD